MVESRINITEKTRLGTLFSFHGQSYLRGNIYHHGYVFRGTHITKTRVNATVTSMSEMQIPQHYSLTSDCLILSHSQQSVSKAALVPGEVKIYI